VIAPHRAPSFLLPRLLALVLIGAALLAPPAARACSICACGDPLLAAQDPAAITGRLRLQLDREYLKMEAANEEDPAVTDQATQWTQRLNVVWRPLEPLSLMATVPWVEKKLRTVGAGPSVTTSDLSGLGDVELAARYALWRSVRIAQRRVQELALSAGTSIPTGEHQARATDGAIIDPHGQIGMGGWGPFAGLSYRLEVGDWTGFASASYRVRTAASYADPAGAFEYRFGDALLWSVHGQHLLGRRVALDLGLDGRYAAKDTATDPDGTEGRVENTGGTVLSVAPGLYFKAVDGLWLFARGQLPIYQDLFGRQDVKASATVGVQYQLF